MERPIVSQTEALEPSGVIADFDAARRLALRKAFAEAAPFPHVVIDDFLTPEGRAAYDQFPPPEWPRWLLFRDEYQREKRACAEIEAIPEPLRAIIEACSRPSFLRVLEEITGLSALLTDPYLDGGGLHSSGPGGVLAPHTDFHLYKRLNLYRAVNLLIYMNPDWTAADGGQLELYRSAEAAPEASVVPILGRAVIFRTDDRSIHGFPRPVAEGRRRNSIALYYYTARETPGFSGDTGTHWRTHGDRLKGVRLAAYEGLIFCSRAIAKAAHLIDPNRPG